MYNNNRSKKIEKPNVFCYSFVCGIFYMFRIENKCPILLCSNKWNNKLNLFMNHIEISFENHSPTENGTFVQQSAHTYVAMRH